MTITTSNNDSGEPEPSGYENEPDEIFLDMNDEDHPPLYHLETADIDDAAFYHRQLALPAGSQVLELGCGTGRIADRLHGWGLNVTGIDLSMAMLRFNHSRRQTPVVQMDMRQLGFSTPFDGVVIAHNTLNLLVSTAVIEQCLSELTGLLHTGSTVVMHLFTPGEEALAHRGQRLFQFSLFPFPGGGTLLKETVRMLDSTSDTLELEERFKLRFLADGSPNRNYRRRCLLAAPSAGEWRALVERAGLTVVAEAGDFSGTPFQENVHSSLLLTASLTR